MCGHRLEPIESHHDYGVEWRGEGNYIKINVRQSGLCVYKYVSTVTRTAVRA